MTSATGNQFPTVNSSVSVALDVWYDLPSLKREALVTVNLTFTDNDGLVFSKSHDVRVTPVSPRGQASGSPGRTTAF